MDRKKLELYFHIPFCVRKCLYCDFLSAPADVTVQDAYMQALIQETISRAAEYREYMVDTVFIGGGTPSAVNAVWIERLLAAVYQFFSVSEEAEITIEVNPGTVNGEKLEQYVHAGVNRVSIGLQSADNEELRRIGRIHTWEEFQETYRLVGEAGIRNVNVDVMSALPEQSSESYYRTLEKVLGLIPPPKHISAYSLIVEEGTPFGEMEEQGLLQLPDEETERQMYAGTEELLGREGYIRYEISNYARKGYACRHNCGYWCRTDYVGFGIGAASMVNNVRFQNGDSLEDYLSDPLACRGNVQHLSVQERMEEVMFLGLRMMVGVSEDAFLREFGRTPEEIYGTIIRKNIEDGLLEYREDAGDRRLVLTGRGIDVSNYVMAQFLFD